LQVFFIYARVDIKEVEMKRQLREIEQQEKIEKTVANCACTVLVVTLVFWASFVPIYIGLFLSLKIFSPWLMILLVLAVSVRAFINPIEVNWWGVFVFSFLPAVSILLYRIFL
jgi:hypothetical protein